MTAYGLPILINSLLFYTAGGLELFSELLQRFPNNIHILLEMAKVGNRSIIEIQNLLSVLTIDTLFEDLCLWMHNV